MIQPFDKNVNLFHKGFKAPDPKNPATGFEDPTYLGFRLTFYPTQIFSTERRMNDNALFTAKEEVIESAERYLESISMNKRASMIRKFSKDMINLSKQTPWYFQSVEGVSSLWRVNKEPIEFDAYRGKEIVLTFNCLESIDLRLTLLVDLYRKASFDYKNMREILPENLREFSCKLEIAEFRKFHRIMEAAEKISTAQNQENANLTILPEGDQNLLQPLDDLISVITFDLRECEFDFEDSFPADAFNIAGEYSQAVQSFKIKVGKVYKEQNQYTLLETILKDDFLNGEKNIIPEGNNTTAEGDINSVDLTGSEFINRDRIDLDPGVPEKLEAKRKSDLQRRAERGLQAIENRVENETQRLQQQARNLINEKVFDNKIADFVRGFLDEVTTGELGSAFEGNPEIEYPARDESAFEGNPEIEYSEAEETVFEGNPEIEYSEAEESVFDGNPEIEYSEAEETVFEGNPEIEYSSEEAKTFEGNPDIKYSSEQAKTFEGKPEIEYSSEQAKTFEGKPEIEYSSEEEKTFEGNPEIEYPTEEEKTFEGNPEIEYSTEEESTFKGNPEIEYSTEEEKTFEGNPEIKYPAPDGKIFEEGEEKKESVLGKVFDLSDLTSEEVKNLEKVFATTTEPKSKEQLGDIYKEVPGKDLGKPDREYPKPEGKIFPDEDPLAKRKKNQNLGKVSRNES